MVDVVGYELDFIPVGARSSRSGDAILCRYRLRDGSLRIIIIDAGTLETGNDVVDHVRKVYGTNYVDDVVSTHPDQDHASGLSVVVRELDVGTLWMHSPWLYSSSVLGLIDDERVTHNSIFDRLRDALRAARTLEETALARQIRIAPPDAGTNIGPFLVLHPSRDHYCQLVPDFPKMPGSKAASVYEYLARTAKSVRDAVFNVFENFDHETLGSTGVTSATNESSVVLYGNLPGGGVLLTADAGLQALNAAAAFARAQGIQVQTGLAVVQVPHHGSRNNVSPAVLDMLLGERRPLNIDETRCAFVSVAAESTTHPRRVVTNAFRRRGFNVYPVRGVAMRHHQAMGRRPGWEATAQNLPLYQQVEEP